MGLRDKYAKKIEEQGFRPLELSEENVQAIFKQCLAGSGSKLHVSILFLKRHGFSEDSKPILFDFHKIISNTQNIGYLLGQLDLFHQNSLTMIPELATKKYGGSSWTTDGRIVTQLMHLANATCYLCGFRKEDSVIDAPVLIKIKPTLSPKDPNFPAWWEAHKAEWAP